MNARFQHTPWIRIGDGGIAALLLACVLCLGLIFSFGCTPTIAPIPLDDEPSNGGEDKDPDDEEPVNGEEPEVVLAFAGGVMKLPVAGAGSVSAASGAQVILRVDLDVSGDIQEAPEFSAVTDDDGRFVIEATELELGEANEAVSGLLAVSLDGHATAYRRVELWPGATPWIDVFLYALGDLELEDRARLPGGAISIDGLPGDVGSGRARLLDTVLDRDGFAGGNHSLGGGLLSFGSVGAITLFDAADEPVTSFEQAVTLRMEILPEAWDRLAVLVPGRSIDPGDNFIDPGDNFIDPGDNFIDPGDNFIDPGDNFSDTAAYVPLVAFDAAVGSWSFEGMGTLEASDGTVVAYGRLPEIWSGTFGGALYVSAEVSHFSQWAYAWPVRRGCLEGELLRATETADELEPAVGVSIVGRGARHVGDAGPVVTDESGRFCLPVRAGSADERIESTIKLYASTEYGRIPIGVFDIEPTEEQALLCGDDGCQNLGTMTLSEPEPDSTPSLCTVMVRVKLPADDPLADDLRPTSAAGARLEASVAASALSSARAFCEAREGDLADCLRAVVGETALTPMYLPRVTDPVVLVGELEHQIEALDELEASTFHYGGRKVLWELPCLEDHEGEDVPEVELELELKEGRIDAIEVTVVREPVDGVRSKLIVDWMADLPTLDSTISELPPLAHRVVILAGPGAEDPDEILWEVVAAEPLKVGLPPGISPPLAVLDHQGERDDLVQLVAPDLDALDDPDSYPNAYVEVHVRVLWRGASWEGVGSGSAVVEPVELGSWSPTSISGSPTGRTGHTAVWTGGEMLVWGGLDSEGRTNTGARYEPSTDSWSPISTEGAPDPRYHHTAVWTGTHMIVWGGSGLDDEYNVRRQDGAKYDPSTDTWQRISLEGVPSARSHHTAVWTGSEMLVWGGHEGESTSTSTGGAYDPHEDAWRPLTVEGAPSARYLHQAVWTGSAMLVWSGYQEGVGFSADGGRYDPIEDSWSPIQTEGAPSPRVFATAVWSADRMIVWGGCDQVNQACLQAVLGDGARYDPVTDEWHPVESTRAPSARAGHSAVWAGEELIVWGGARESGGTLLSSSLGGRYSNGLWTPTAATNGEPMPRYSHTAVWTGQEMIVWGGEDDTLGTGGRFTPP